LCLSLRTIVTVATPVALTWTRTLSSLTDANLLRVQTAGRPSAA
jgi:hypothetical protein